MIRQDGNSSGSRQLLLTSGLAQISGCLKQLLQWKRAMNWHGVSHTPCLPVACCPPSCFKWLYFTHWELSRGGSGEWQPTSPSQAARSSSSRAEVFWSSLPREIRTGSLHRLLCQEGQVGTKRQNSTFIPSGLLLPPVTFSAQPCWNTLFVSIGLVVGARGKRWNSLQGRRKKMGVAPQTTVLYPAPISLPNGLLLSAAGQGKQWQWPQQRWGTHMHKHAHHFIFKKGDTADLVLALVPLGRHSQQQHR